MELKEVNIYKHPGIEGRYGNRYAIPNKRARLIEIFDSVKIFRFSIEKIKGEYYTVFELPMGMDVENNPLIMYWINGLNAKII